MAQETGKGILPQSFLSEGVSEWAGGGERIRSATWLFSIAESPIKLWLEATPAMHNSVFQGVFPKLGTSTWAWAIYI